MHDARKVQCEDRRVHDARKVQCENCSEEIRLEGRLLIDPYPLSAKRRDTLKHAASHRQRARWTRSIMRCRGILGSDAAQRLMPTEPPPWPEGAASTKMASRASPLSFIHRASLQSPRLSPSGAG